MFGFRRKYKCRLNQRVLIDSGHCSGQHQSLIEPLAIWLQTNNIEYERDGWQPEKIAFYEKGDFIAFKLTFPEAILELS